MKSSILPTAFVSALILTLAGCGGSGSSSTVKYSVGGTVSGLGGTGLVLQNNGGDDLTVAGNTFEFTIALDDGSDYAVTVQSHPTGQTCSLGNRTGTIAGANITNVTVTCRAWDTATMIESSSGNASAPRIGADADGNALAVWLQNNGSTNVIWANHYTADSGWDNTPVDLTSGTSRSPQVAVNGNGTAVAVWPEYDSGTSSYAIYANRYTAGAGWDASSTRIDLGDSSPANRPQAAIDHNGNAVAVWSQTDATGTSIYANRYSADSSSWVGATALENTTGDGDFPQIAMDSQGNAFAIWRQHDGTASSVYGSRYDVGNDSWGAPTLLETTDGLAFDPQVALDSRGNAVAVWAQEDGTWESIYANRYTAGSGWGEAELLEQGDAGHAQLPQIALDSHGNALAVWRQDDGTAYSAYASRYDVSTDSWDAAPTLLESSDWDAYYPQIALDGSGNAVVVWAQGDGMVDNIYANRYTAGSGWSAAELLDTEDAQAGGEEGPRITIDGNGNAFAIWEQLGGGLNADIWASRYH